MTPLQLTLLVVAGLIITGLAFYAGNLLYLLHIQNKTGRSKAKARRGYLDESIYTISLAVSQQQCSLSEASIRLCVLLDHLGDNSHYPDVYPAIHELYARIRHMPTHDAWKALPKEEKRRMEQEREAHEAELETKILRETEQLIQHHRPNNETSS